MNKNQDINFYVDCLIVEALSSSTMVKTAEGFSISELISNVSNFFTEQFGKASPQDQYAPSSGKPSAADNAIKFLSFIAPGVIFTTFRRMGFTKIGVLLSIAASVYDVKIEKILSDIYAKISTLISSDQKIAPEKVDEIVNNAVDQNAGATDVAMAKESIDHRIRSAKLISLAIDNYQSNNALSYKIAAPPIKVPKGTVISSLKTALGWFFKTALISAGFSFISPIIGNLLGINPEGVKSKTPATDAIKRIKMQTGVDSSSELLPTDPGYKDVVHGSGWAEKYTANKSDIEDMLIDFTNQIYSNLNAPDEAFFQSNIFNNVAHSILIYNRNNLGGSFTFLPDKIGERIIQTKKQIVDLFLPEIILNKIKFEKEGKSFSKTNTSEYPGTYNTYVSSSPPKEPTGPVFYSKSNPKYSIVIADKWKERMNPQQSELLSKLRPEEQKKVEQYLDSLSFFELLRINNLSEEEKVKLFEDKVKEHLGEDAYRRVTS